MCQSSLEIQQLQNQAKIAEEEAESLKRQLLERQQAFEKNIRTWDDDSWSSIPWISGENPQETRRFRQEPAGKCQEFDGGIR